MTFAGGQVFRGEIPGLSVGSIAYRVQATDLAGNTGLSTTLGFTAGPCSGGSESYCTAGTSASGCQAVMSAVGSASPTAGSGFVVAAAGVEGQKDGTFFFGQNGRQANPWGNGTSWQCVVPPVHRGGALAGNGTSGACNQVSSQDLNARWCATCPKPNHAPIPGVKLQIQLWYRDPQNTGNQSTSLSDALEVDVCP